MEPSKTILFYLMINIRVIANKTSLIFHFLKPRCLFHQINSSVRKSLFLWNLLIFIFPVFLNLSLTVTQVLHFCIIRSIICLLTSRILGVKFSTPGEDLIIDAQYLCLILLGLSLLTRCPRITWHRSDQVEGFDPGTTPN